MISPAQPNALLSTNTDNITTPLVVDLDGTLILTDLLHESALGLLTQDPIKALKAPLMLTKGKAQFKHYIAKHVDIDASTLPYHESFLTWLKQQKAQGRFLVLCTASDARYANAVAAHLEIFDEVIATNQSNTQINLAGNHKAHALIQRFGNKQFDYAGNSSVDLFVWQHARSAIVVNASARLLKQTQAICTVSHIFSTPKIGIKTIAKTLRVHQWLKNILLFVPLIAAFQTQHMINWCLLLIAFIAFSGCASAVYILNDLLDLNSDRQHPRKKHRPFASGKLSIAIGIVACPLLLLLSFNLAAWLSANYQNFFVGWLVAYFMLTCLYSFWLKRLILVDCIVLAMLYTLRVIAGAAAIDQALSFWLLCFGVFLFLSLAFIKRYAELLLQTQSNKLHGRAYLKSDAPLIQQFGVMSAYASVLVLALYLNSHEIVMLYPSPKFVWGALTVMLFWVSWMWLKAHRGQMHDDPLVFAVKDRISLISGALFILSLVLGAGGWSWLSHALLNFH